MLTVKLSNFLEKIATLLLKHNTYSEAKDVTLGIRTYILTVKHTCISKANGFNIFFNFLRGFLRRTVINEVI